MRRIGNPQKEFTAIPERELEGQEIPTEKGRKRAKEPIPAPASPVPKKAPEKVPEKVGV